MYNVYRIFSTLLEENNEIVEEILLKYNFVRTIVATKKFSYPECAITFLG